MFREQVFCGKGRNGGEKDEISLQWASGDERKGHRDKKIHRSRARIIYNKFGSLLNYNWVRQQKYEVSTKTIGRWNDIDRTSGANKHFEIL